MHTIARSKQKKGRERRGIRYNITTQYMRNQFLFLEFYEHANHKMYLFIFAYEK